MSEAERLIQTGKQALPAPRLISKTSPDKPRDHFRRCAAPSNYRTPNTSGSTLQSAISELNRKGLGYNYIVEKIGLLHPWYR
jgi:hypothetical protein